MSNSLHCALIGSGRKNATRFDSKLDGLGTSSPLCRLAQPTLPGCCYRRLRESQALSEAADQLLRPKVAPEERCQREFVDINVAIGRVDEDLVSDCTIASSGLWSLLMEMSLPGKFKAKVISMGKSDKHHVSGRELGHSKPRSLASDHCTALRAHTPTHPKAHDMKSAVPAHR